MRLPGRLPSCRASTLVESAIAILMLSVVTATLISSTAIMMHQLVVTDTDSALSDELVRQAELVRASPLSTLVADTPLVDSEGTSSPFLNQNVLPLNGFSSGAGASKPNVSWIRTRTLIPNGPSTYTDSVKVTAWIQIGSTTLTNQATVVRAFDAGE